MANFYDKASLVLIPSGTKESLVFSQKPTNGDGDFTFSRSTSATRVGPSGYIEKETQNLLLQSNTFDTTWATTNTSVTGGQSGYDGSSDAWLLSKSAANANLRQSISSSGVHSFSIYAKAGSLNWVALQLSGGVSPYVYFDLSTGNIGTQSNNIDAIATSIGSGWYRISIIASNAVNSVYIYPADGDNYLSGTSGNIYIQDAQLEQGLVARDYIETTTTAVYGGITDNIPRLDYNGSCPSLLLEPQRSNLITNSENFSDSDWVKQGVSLTNNYALSPDKNTNATLVNEGTAASDVHWWWQNFTFSLNTDYTISIYAKYVSRKNIVINLYNGVSSNFIFYDIQNGTILNSTGDVNATITDVGNGWYKLTYTRTTESSGTPNFRIGLASDTPFQTYTGENKEALIWGAQLEEGSYATSYIPTYGSAVTRNADVCQKTSASDLIGQTEGTLFVEATNFFPSGLRTIALLYTSGSAFYQVYINASNQVRVDINGSFIFLGGSIAANTNYKIAFAYKSGEYALYLNGTQIATSTNTTIPSSLTDYYLGNSLGVEQSGEFAQTALFKTRLTNDELATLTTI